jgi:hypothetical protein
MFEVWDHVFTGGELYFTTDDTFNIIPIISFNLRDAVRHIFSILVSNTPNPICTTH